MKSATLTVIRRLNLTRLALTSVLVMAAMLAVPHISHAQGVFGGMDEGARRGNREAGPVGAVVGGAVGGAVGGVNGVLGINPHYHHHHYHHRHHH